MFVQASQQVRHFIGRLDRGAGVHEALIALAQAHNIFAASVTAVGAFESATLGTYDQAARKDRPPRRFTTPMDVVSLVGNISLQNGDPVVHLYATVSRETDNGAEVLGGRLFAAQAFALEFTVVALDDVTLERSPDPGTGMALWRPVDYVPPVYPSRAAPMGSSSTLNPPTAMASAAPAAPAPRAPEVVYKPAPRNAPAEAVAPRDVAPSKASRTAESPVASTRAPEAPTLAHPEALPPRFVRPQEPEFTEEIGGGDYVQHPRFGEVEVLRVTDTGRLEIRLPTGSLKEISVEIFDIQGRPDREGHRVWLLTNKAPR